MPDNLKFIITYVAVSLELIFILSNKQPKKNNKKVAQDKNR